MNVGVIGAGAIGGWAAASLAAAGQRVNLLARGATLAALSADGLLLTDGESTRQVAVRAADDPGVHGPQDVLLIAVKAPSLAAAAEAARPMIGKDTLIVPMLNGVPWWFTNSPLSSVDPDGRIAAALPSGQVIGCVVHAACSRIGPNHVQLRHCDSVIIGEPNGGRISRIGTVCDLFQSAGIRCDTSDDIRRAIWYKLWGNATLNPLSALTRATADRIIGDPVLRSFMLDAMDELARVGTAIGCPIEESGEARMEVTTRLGSFKTSMLQDLEAGRAIELEALVGAPREIAARAGIATPALDRIYAMARLLAESSEGL